MARLIKTAGPRLRTRCFKRIEKIRPDKTAASQRKTALFQAAEGFIRTFIPCLRFPGYAERIENAPYTSG